MGKHANGSARAKTRDARAIEVLYDTKAHGTGHQTVVRLIQERGLDGAIEQLEAWGMKPLTPKAHAT